MKKKENNSQISNSNWTEWSTIQGVIARVISKSRSDYYMKAIKARVIDVKITWVSNYRCPITKRSNGTSVIGHPRDRAPITSQIGARRTNHDREFCYRYD